MANRLTHRNLPGLLREAREVLKAQMGMHLRRHKLTDQQWRVLRVIDERVGTGTSEMEAGRIAREAQILPPSLTGILTRMERDGLIARHKGVEDARFTVVCLTEKGQELVRSMSAPLEAYYAWLEGHLGKRRIDQLYDLLDAVIALGHETDLENVETTGAKSMVKDQPA